MFTERQLRKIEKGLRGTTRPNLYERQRIRAKRKANKLIVNGKNKEVVDIWLNRKLAHIHFNENYETTDW